MTSAADISALIANAQITTGRGRDGHFAKVELPVIPDYSSGKTEGPVPLIAEIHTSKGWRGVSTYGSFYALRPNGMRHTVVHLDGSGPDSFSRAHEVARFTEKAAAKLHAETLASAEFQAWLAQSLEYFRAGGKL